MGEPRGFLVVPIGTDPDGDLRSLELDADDALKIALSSAAKGLVGPHGWIGGAWQKNPLLLGYSAALKRTWTNNNLAAGTATATYSAVPNGELWVVTAYAVQYVGTPPTSLQANILSGGVNYPIGDVPTPTSGQWYLNYGQFILAPGDQLRVIVYGATAGDDASGKAVGYTVDIDQ